jgi:tRNA A-37 threonylcarbamoyl transferase component Bud32
VVAIRNNRARATAASETSTVSKSDAGASCQQRAQIVHGDLTTNVLFAEGLPPLIIDVSPY